MCGIFVSCCTESSIEDRTQELKSKDESIARLEKNILEKSNTIARLQSDVELLQARFQKPPLHVSCLFYSILKIFLVSLLNINSAVMCTILWIKKMVQLPPLYCRKKGLLMLRSWPGRLMHELENLRSRLTRERGTL